jgi:hypothetical protein
MNLHKVNNKWKIILILRSKSGKISQCRGVAQHGSVPAWGVGGRRFESDRPDQAQFVRKGA